jgi:transposase
MESNQRHPTQRPGSPRWPRPSMERQAPSTQWSTLDPAHRGTMGRHARSIWCPHHCTPSVPKLGSLWGDRTSAVGHRARSQRSRWLGSPRMLYRRNVCSGEKRGRCVGPTKRGKGTKIMAIADSHGLPIAVCTESASPAEVKLVKQTIEARFVPQPPQRLIGDKAYDSDGLDEQMLNEFGTEVIAPHRQGRRPDRKTQDDRPLRRFCRRWKVERMFSWMYNFRRLVVRWEYHAENYLGFVQLACAMILIRYL